jgi:OOP family OmpA-OmpF porin
MRERSSDFSRLNKLNRHLKYPVFLEKIMKFVNNIGHVGALTTLTLMSCAMLVTQLAHAAEESKNPDWANEAGYIGGGLGRSKATIDQDRLVRSLSAGGANSVLFSSDERDTAFKLFAGKQLTRNFALEGAYFDLGRFGFNAVTTPPGSLNGNVSFRGLSLDLLAQLPLSESFSVYGRVGANYAKASARFTGDRLFALTNPNPSERKFNPKVGLGLEYKFTDALAVRGEVERYRVNDSVRNRGDVDFYSINLVYKFGKPAPSSPVVFIPAPAPTSVAQAKIEPPPVLVTPPPPPPPKPIPVSEKVTFAAEALFDFDKSVVKPQGQTALDDLLSKLQGMDTEVMITVGHTDSVGSDAYNQKLSVRRAEAVKAYLVSKGIDASRVFAEGKGEAQSVADNKTAEGRAKNRRVTVEVVGTRMVIK